MNVDNSLGSRPSIRLYPGVSSGGSFASFCGGTDGAPVSRGAAASRVLKQVQQQKDSSANLMAGRPAKDTQRESPGSSLKRRTVIDAVSRCAGSDAPSQA